MATTTVKPYKAILDKYDAEIEKKWRPRTEEEMAALRAAADDPDNKVKVTRFRRPPTVLDVLIALSKQPEEAIVVMSSDSEGNAYSPVLDITEAHAADRDEATEGIERGVKVVTLYPSL